MARSPVKSEPVYNFLIRESHFLCLIKLLRFQLRVYCKAAIMSGRICEVLKPSQASLGAIAGAIAGAFSAKSTGLASVRLEDII